MSATRRAVNINMDRELIVELRALEINLSQVCEGLLREYLRGEKERRWKEEHASFIAGYNELLEREGPPLSEWRSF